MKKLFDLVELVSNTEEAVVLKVKPGSEIDLICLGCFTGDETLLRLTKGKSIECTVWTSKGGHYSWQWGDGGLTLVTDSMTKKGRMIQHCIEDEFDILVYGNKEAIRRDMHRPTGVVKHTIVLWTNSMGCGCRKNDEFYRYFESKEIAIKHFQALGFVVTLIKSQPNCCNSISYYYSLCK